MSCQHFIERIILNFRSCVRIGYDSAVSKRRDSSELYEVTHSLRGMPLLCTCKNTTITATRLARGLATLPITATGLALGLATLPCSPSLFPVTAVQQQDALHAAGVWDLLLSKQHGLFYCEVL